MPTQRQIFSILRVLREETQDSDVTPSQIVGTKFNINHGDLQKWVDKHGIILKDYLDDDDKLQKLMMTYHMGK